MDQDFAKRRVRTPLAEPSPPPKSSGLALLLTGLLTGITVGLFLSLLIYLSGVLPPPPDADAEVINSSLSANDNPDETLSEELEREAARLQLEFYRELPNYEVSVDATPIAGSQPRTPATQTVTETSNTDENAEEVSTEESTTAQQASTVNQVDESRAEAQESIVPSAVSAGRYLLQAGAFQQQAAASAQLNRLLALGLDARIRQDNLSGRGLFLVQAGPYDNRDQMLRAERLLRSNSIEIMRITLSQP